jgi:FkbM family methyltransferase
MLRRILQAWRRRVGLPFRRAVCPEIELVVGNKRLRVDLRDRVIGQLLYLDGCYAAHFEQMLRLAARPGTLCIDVGANLGLCSVVLEDAAGPNGRVLAFEPEEQNFRLLEHNLQLNQASNVEAFRYAVGQESGAVMMRRNTVNFGDHRVSICPENTPAAVPMVCIDDMLAKQPPLPVSVTKIDVQGFELQVIKGMHRTLKANRDLVLFIEVFPEALRQAGTSGCELMSHLQSAGFSGYEFSSRRVQPMGPPQIYDWLADGTDIDCVLSRNPDAVNSLVDDYMRDTFRRVPGRQAVISVSHSARARVQKSHSVG